MRERCEVCGGDGCDGRRHPHTGPLPRCLGGQGLDQARPLRPVIGKRARRGPLEDRAVHGPTEDRSRC